VENRNKNAKNAAAAYAARKVDRAVYDALSAVFIDGKYCAQAITAALKTLKNDQAVAFVTSSFYGVLDNNVRLEKFISGLCSKPPEKAAATVLKIGMYYLKYSDMPPYAAVNRTVELSKEIGGVYSGFINAVLKKSAEFKPTFKSGLERFAFEHNTPEWLCRMLITDYSEQRAAAILDAKLPDKTHIRPVRGRITKAEFDAAAGKSEFTDYGCYCDKKTLENFAQGTYAVQSLSSIKAVNAYVNGISGGKALDLCAAPGGKSVLLSELGDFDITACDIYEHKINLMKGYAAKLGAKIKTVLNDAAVLNKDFVGKFDLVIADCPCSGTGTLKSKPDIMLHRKPSDLKELTALQSKILDCAAAYCKPGGTLCYSTCSMLKCENDEIAEKFLSEHREYAPIDSVAFLPDTDKCDGFYIARFKRIAE